MNLWVYSPEVTLVTPFFWIGDLPINCINQGVHPSFPFACFTQPSSPCVWAAFLGGRQASRCPCFWINPPIWGMRGSSKEAGLEASALHSLVNSVPLGPRQGLKWHARSRAIGMLSPWKRNRHARRPACQNDVESSSR